VPGRTLVIGDIHGDLAALERLLDKLPALDESDTMVFLGDYVDRGPHSAGVVALVRALEEEGPAHVVCLRGNHEDRWIDSYEKPDAPFLVQVGNGCSATYRSFSGGPPLNSLEEGLDISEYPKMLAVSSWLPADVVEWMRSLRLFYEDEHAIYVHAGLERDGAGGWKSAQESDPQSVLWMREPSFFSGYRGKRLVFGHTPVGELPLPDPPASGPDGAAPGVWIHDTLIGIDTGSGKGGFLSAIELPALRVFESR